jgi:hypothetical protein
MVNSEMIRINKLQFITSSGFIVILHSVSSQLSNWMSILDEFQQKTKEVLDESCHKDFKLIQHNNHSRATFQVPFCRQFRKLSDMMEYSFEFTQNANANRTSKISFFCSRMNLEQAFLAYASYQKEKEDDETALNT